MVLLSLEHKSYHEPNKFPPKSVADISATNVRNTSIYLQRQNENTLSTTKIHLPNVQVVNTIERAKLLFPPNPQMYPKTKVLNI